MHKAFENVSYSCVYNVKSRKSFLKTSPRVDEWHKVLTSLEDRGIITCCDQGMDQLEDAEPPSNGNGQDFLKPIKFELQQRP